MTIYIYRVEEDGAVQVTGGRCGMCDKRQV